LSIIHYPLPSSAPAESAASAYDAPGFVFNRAPAVWARTGEQVELALNLGYRRAFFSSGSRLQVVLDSDAYSVGAGEDRPSGIPAWARTSDAPQVLSDRLSVDPGSQ